MLIGALNTGSSSIKLKLFDASSVELPVVTHTSITGIGGHVNWVLSGESKPLPQEVNDLASALNFLLTWFAEKKDPIIVMGHRIVHGGENFSHPTRLDKPKLAQLKALEPLAPLHQPFNLMGVDILSKTSPHTIQIGCFDTAFHANHEPVFKRYALPDDWYQKGVQRYGFHGLAYEWVVRELSRKKPTLLQKKVVAAHLGSGASVCAIEHGRSIDSTMGMTAIGGLMMSTRCGDIDPGVLLHMMERLSSKELSHLLYKESGLKGVSGISSDMRILLESPSPQAKLAVDMFVLSAAQNIARMAVSLGGMDVLVLSGGIGENASSIREQITQRLSLMRSFEAVVVPVDEEHMIAQHCLNWWRENRL